MQQNNITPQAADIGAQLTQAILSVLAEPKAAAAAAKGVADARMLSEEEVKKAEDAREFMATADTLAKELGKISNDQDEREAVLKADREKLNDAMAIHTTNVDRFAESVRLHNSDLANHDLEVKQLEANKKAFASEYSQLLDEQEQLKIDRADVERRENFLAQAAGNLKAVG